MRFSTGETQRIASVFVLGVALFIVSVGHTAPLDAGKSSTGKSGLKKHALLARAQRQLASRRRWDSDLSAHPSRGSYRRRLSVSATAYQPIDDPMEGGRWTKTERDGRAVHGVAVDPALIPLGTRLWVPGYGHAMADDIGGAIKGHRIDLRMQSGDKMRNWGVRRVEIYILN